MGLFDKVLKDVTKGLQEAADKANEELKNHAEKAAEKAADKAVGEAADKAVSEASDATTEFTGEMKGEIEKLKDAFNDMNDAIKDANEEMSKVSDEDWAKAQSTLERMAMDSLKDMRVCLECDNPVKGDMKFCPKCGAKLPDKTVLELATCSKCGKQNAAGTDFCTECGAKLPYKELVEAKQREKDQAVLDKWDEKLPWFPAWACGGTDYDLAELEEGRFVFSAWFENDYEGSKAAVADYIRILKDAGFRQAGKYLDDHHLYKMIDGVCYHADTEHCFEGGGDSPSVYFETNSEPPGGFDYVKPEPKKKSGNPFGSLFK